MLNNATLAQLRTLKLQGFADAFQQQLDQADCLGLSFDERLKLSHQMRFSEMSRKNRSTMLSHEALVGVKCMAKREGLASHTRYIHPEAANHAQGVGPAFEHHGMPRYFGHSGRHYPYEEI